MSSDDIPISKTPTMHGIPAYLDTALWQSQLQIQQAKDDGDSLWIHGFLCGLGVALVISLVAFWCRRRLPRTQG